MTSSFLTLDRAVTGCQNVESLAQCNNRKFLDQLRSTCNCYPPNLRDIMDKVGDGGDGDVDDDDDDEDDSYGEM